MNIKTLTFLISLFVISATAMGQDAPNDSKSGEYAKAADSVRQRLTRSVEELNRLRQQIADEKVPLSRTLSDLENELSEVRKEYQEATRELDNTTLDLSNLTTDIKSREKEADYLSNLLSEYLRNFESRLHIAEMQRYRQAVEQARLAPENSNLSQKEIFEAQTKILSVSLDRLEEALGGARFEGRAVGQDGLVTTGTFVVVGPTAIFRSGNGEHVGTVQQRLGSLEPAIIPFGNPLDSEGAAQVVAGTGGFFPLDPTMGNAHKIEETDETFLEHVKKGGLVMYPIFGMAGVALLVAFFKWLSMFFLRAPSQKRLHALLNAVGQRKKAEALAEARGMMEIHSHFVRDGMMGAVIGGLFGAMLHFLARSIPNAVLWWDAASPNSLSYLIALGGIAGIVLMIMSQRLFGYSPTGMMLVTGVEHLDEPRELIEEVMYEEVLATRLKLQSYLPFISICAASAPLLGLLGTVTGIINTFKLITIFGSGDVKTLSGGISEALITTEFGLIVAIPSLLLHAFLSRKAKGAVDQMEKSAIALVNRISKLPQQTETSGKTRSTEQPSENKTIPVTTFGAVAEAKEAADQFMDSKVVAVGRKATVEEAIQAMEGSEIDDVDVVYIIDDEGKYVGHVMKSNLIVASGEQPVEGLMERHPLFVRTDTRRRDVQYLFGKHDLTSMPVLDQHDVLVGRVNRKTKETK